MGNGGAGVANARNYVPAENTDLESCEGGWLPIFFQGADGRFPCLTKVETLLPVHTELSLSRFPDDAIHVSGFGGGDCGVL